MLFIRIFSVFRLQPLCACVCHLCLQLNKKCCASEHHLNPVRLLTGGPAVTDRGEDGPDSHWGNLSMRGSWLQRQPNTGLFSFEVSVCTNCHFPILYFLILYSVVQLCYLQYLDVLSLIGIVPKYQQISSQQNQRFDIVRGVLLFRICICKEPHVPVFIQLSSWI